MVETRIARRHRILKTATIEFGGDAIDCMVRDLSVTGAALEVCEIPISYPGRWIASALSCRLAQRISDRRGFRLGRLSWRERRVTID